MEIKCHLTGKQINILISLLPENPVNLQNIFNSVFLYRNDIIYLVNHYINNESPYTIFRLHFYEVLLKYLPTCIRHHQSV